MAIKSTFDRGGDGMTRGGLDRYLGPPAEDYSNLPESITDPLAEDDPQIEVDCQGKNKDEAVCEIAKVNADKPFPDVSGQ